MKKVLLLVVSFIFLLGSAVFAYETVVVDFPTDEGWHSVIYETQGNEAILQYVPNGQTNTSWTRAVIFHSYKDDDFDNQNSALNIGRSVLSEMQKRNGSAQYKFIKYTEEDSIATRCITGNANIGSQCEIFRSAKSQEGVVTMHYINKNKSNFNATYNQWYNIVKGIRTYYSYWRNDRVLNKATYFEL